jgi:hypothetical protein
VSKTNVAVLLSTVLLGVLLYLVNGIVEKTANPGEPPPVEKPEPAPETKLGSFTELRDELTKLNIDADQAIQSWLVWLEQRGYLGELPLLNRDTGQAPLNRYRDIDDARLIAQAGDGDIGASQTLASRSIASDPLEAIEWYRQAATYGSVYAMLRLGDLLATFANPQLATFSTDPEYSVRLAQLREDSESLQQDALAWTITAVVAGGLPVLQRDVVERLHSNTASLDPVAVINACNQAERLLLELATARRARGGSVFTMEPPEAFLSEGITRDAIPCDPPILPIVDTSNCKAHPLYAETGNKQLLWVCAES